MQMRCQDPCKTALPSFMGAGVSGGAIGGYIAFPRRKKKNNKTCSRKGQGSLIDVWEDGDDSTYQPFPLKRRTTTTLKGRDCSHSVLGNCLEDSSDKRR